MSANPKCEACGKRFPAKAAWRTDSNGFTACFPAFPRSNTNDRLMEGECYRDQSDAA